MRILDWAQTSSGPSWAQWEAGAFRRVRARRNPYKSVTGDLVVVLWPLSNHARPRFRLEGKAVMRLKLRGK